MRFALRETARKLPYVGVVDPAGQYGDDPAAIVVDVYEPESKLDGALLPLGPKGFGMMLIVELLCSALAGAAGSWSNDYEPTGEAPWNPPLLSRAGSLRVSA